MINLADISSALGPPKKTIRFGETEFEIQGLSARDLGSIVRRFPEFEELMTAVADAPDAGAAPADGQANGVAARALSPEAQSRLVKMSDSAWPAVIACGVGLPNDPEAEKKIGGWRLDVQAELVGAIMQLTYPEARTRPSTGSGSPAPGPDADADQAQAQQPT